MIIRLIVAALIGVAAIAAITDAPAATPEGLWLVYGEDSGMAFVDYQAAQAETGSWPLDFHYFQDGAAIGSARMTARADCAQGLLIGRLIEVNGQPATGEMPNFTFDRAGGGGDAALVDFACGSDGARIMQAEIPIAVSEEAAVAAYLRLVGAGLAPDLARRLAIRTPVEATTLAATIVPEDMRANVVSLLTPVEQP